MLVENGAACGLSHRIFLPPTRIITGEQAFFAVESLLDGRL
jgi:hypothetical protein